MNSRVSYFAAATWLLALASPSLADWPAGGKLVQCNMQASRGLGHARIFESPSGDLLLMSVGLGQAGSGWSVGKITRDGELVPGWGYGVDLGTTGFSPLAAAVAADDSNGFWFVRVNGCNARHVLPGGAPEPAPFSWWTVGNCGFYVGGTAAEGSSDFYYARASRLQRLTRTGGVAPGWPASGRVVMPDDGYDIFPPELLPDGSGGAVQFSMQPFSGPRAMRVDANSSLHAGWPAGGLVLGPPTSDLQNYNTPMWLGTPLVRSGSDHFLAAWADFNSTSVLRVVMQRFGLDGTLDPAWPADGLQVVAPDSIEHVTVVADGEGGAFVLWERAQRPFGTHLHSDGTFVGGLTDAGIPLIPAGAPYVPSESLAHPSFPLGLVADHGLDGGLVFVSSEPYAPVQPTLAMRVRWLQADLAPEPAEPADGLLVIDDSIRFAEGIQRAALADGIGGIFLAWSSQLPGPCSEGRVAMTRISRPSVTGVPPTAATAGFALGGAMPNPVRGSVSLRCTLPDERSARLEVFDAGGRRWRSATVSGAGEHSLRFDDLGELPPGLYLARLALGREIRTSRFVKLQ